MSAAIRIFQVGEKCFTHVVNTYDGSVELHDENDEVLLVYGPDAKVTDREGRMGVFHNECLDGQLRWVYYERKCQTRTVLGPDLPSAEVEVSKRYIGNA